MILLNVSVSFSPSVPVEIVRPTDGERSGYASNDDFYVMKSARRHRRRLGLARSCNYVLFHNQAPPRHRMFGLAVLRVQLLRRPSFLRRQLSLL